jgi:pyridoxamine 5'-phosphate oxidase
MESVSTSDLHDLLRSLRMPEGEAPEFDVATTADPFEVFARWLQCAIDGGVAAPHNITLSTVDEDGLPDARTVLLREVWMPQGATEPGAVGLATSSHSPKGRQLESRPHAAVVSYWREQHRQVRMRGRVERAPSEAVAADFRDRGLGFKAAALFGHQSDPLPPDMDERLSEARTRAEDHPDFVPDDWSVYRLIPNSIEFWQGQPGQAQRRIQFIRTDGLWNGLELIP